MFWGKESLAVSIYSVMPFRLRVIEFSSYLFVLIQLAMECLGGKVVLRCSSLLLRKKILGKTERNGRGGKSNAEPAVVK